MSDPTWTPRLADVGAYVISRTAAAEAADGTTVNTFTADTFPTALQVAEMLSNVCAWVTATVGVVSDDLSSLATTAAALRTAGLIQLSLPVRDGDVQNGAALLAQADKALASLKGAQESSGATVPGGMSPRGSFPPAPRQTVDWADYRRGYVWPQVNL